MGFGIAVMLGSVVFVGPLACDDESSSAAEVVVDAAGDARSDGVTALPYGTTDTIEIEFSVFGAAQRLSWIRVDLATHRLSRSVNETACDADAGADAGDAGDSGPACITRVTTIEHELTPPEREAALAALSRIEIASRANAAGCLGSDGPSYRVTVTTTAGAATWYGDGISHNDARNGCARGLAEAYASLGELAPCTCMGTGGYLPCVCVADP